MPEITPVQYAHRNKMRPQMVYNWIKQGCPVNEIAGKKYVDPALVDEWLEEKDKRKAKRKVEAAEKREKDDRVGRDASEALLKFRPRKLEHYCVNCEKNTVFLCDLMFAGDPIDNYFTAYCSECRLNHRVQNNIPNEVIRGVLLEDKPMWVACVVEKCDCGRQVFPFDWKNALTAGVPKREEEEVEVEAS